MSKQRQKKVLSSKPLIDGRPNTSWHVRLWWYTTALQCSCWQLSVSLHFVFSIFLVWLWWGLKTPGTWQRQKQVSKGKKISCQTFILLSRGLLADTITPFGKKEEKKNQARSHTMKACPEVNSFNSLLLPSMRRCNSVHAHSQRHKQTFTLSGSPQVCQGIGAFSFCPPPFSVNRSLDKKSLERLSPWLACHYH